jgi:general secretion pathway protein E
MTLEDPVEYEVPGVRHVHIRHTHGVTFASGLRSALRQDPDVIMIGEIRDGETARVAAHTALTGHLVLSTLHTSSAVEAIVRLADMGLERYLLASTLRLIVSQRLVRKICTDCWGGGLSKDSGSVICPACRGIGLRDRSVISEVLRVGPELRELIGAGASAQAIVVATKADGFRPMSEDAAEKVDWGITTNEEIRAALYS